ncbi:MAG TPA: type II toxin-antitoxin system VapC family toxin [Candidatus Nanopelagicales bacterium]|nr:type II toxin-antitoxin system VapC family toxin [Candidatus Nanopelagicales bacterium]
MFAADTNVLIRVLVGDDRRQQKAALARLEAIRTSGGSVVVSSVVLAEVAWVLDRAYDYERAQIVSALRGVLDTPPFFIPQRPDVLAAIDEYASGSADFADYLILSLARAEGSKTLLTFDRRLLRTAGCEAP